MRNVPLAMARMLRYAVSKETIARLTGWQKEPTIICSGQLLLDKMRSKATVAPVAICPMERHHFAL